jgi:hypothetical protein
VSRPTAPAFPAPSFTVRTWATSTNYAAGSHPWSSNPLKVEPPSPAGGFVPDTGAGAPYVNKLFYDAFVQDQAAKDQFSTLNTYLETRDAEHLASFGQIQALHFDAKVTLAALAGVAVWDEYLHRWWFCSSITGRAYYSYDSAHSIGGYGSVTSWGSTTSPCAGDSDGAGNVVIGFTSADQAYGTADDGSCWDGTLGVWNKRTVTGFAANGQCAGMVYDPINSKWCGVQVSSAGVGAASTSTDRTTWTASTLPAGSTSSLSPTGACAAIRKDTGRILFVGDDGGATWAALVNFASAADPTAGMTLTHVTGDTWVMAATTTSASKVYKSTDNGATWSLVSTLANYRLRRIVAVGSLLVAYANTSGFFQSPVYSTDTGTTWKHGNNTFAFSAPVASAGAGVFYGGGQVVAIAGADVYPGIRYGDPGATLT